jgi:hypothetical protein
MRAAAARLQHVHVHGRLRVRGGGERLALGGGQRGVARDELRHHAAQRLHAQRQRRHVQQHDLLHLAGQHARLHGGAEGHHFIRVYRQVGLLAAGELAHERLHARDAR